MKHFILIFLTILFISCNNTSQDSSSFQLIDVSMFNGWTDVYCMKINNKGDTYIFNNNINKGKTYFKTKIGLSEVDSISKYVKIILSSKLDTLYRNSCQDCGAYSLIIKSKNVTFHSRVDGISSTDKEIDAMNDLIDYLYDIAKISRDSLDSNFNFESNAISILPPPPPPLEDKNIKFTPPNVIDTVH